MQNFDAEESRKLKDCRVFRGNGVGMDSVVWGLVGTTIGGLLAILGNLAAVRLQQRTQRQRLEATRNSQRREEKKHVYLRLLDCTRRLRFLAEPGRERPQPIMDELLTTLSAVNYEIGLICELEVSHMSGQLARGVRKLMDLAKQLDESTSKTPAQIENKEAEYRQHKAHVQQLVKDFIVVTRADLDRTYSPITAAKIDDTKAELD